MEEEIARILRDTRKFRILNHMTWRRLSEVTGIPAATLFGWLEEGRRPSITGLQRLVTALRLNRSPVHEKVGFEVSVSIEGATYRLARIPKGRPFSVRAPERRYVAKSA